MISIVDSKTKPLFETRPHALGIVNKKQLALMVNVHAVVEPRQLIRACFVLNDLNCEFFRVLCQGAHGPLRVPSYRLKKLILYG